MRALREYPSIDERDSFSRSYKAGHAKWEYMWIYVDDSTGKPVYVANGERLPAQTYAEALNVVGKEGWELVAVLPPSVVRAATQAYAQFCLKRPLAD